MSVVFTQPGSFKNIKILRSLVFSRKKKQFQNSCLETCKDQNIWMVLVFMITFGSHLEMILLALSFVESLLNSDVQYKTEWYAVVWLFIAVQVQHITLSLLCVEAEFLWWTFLLNGISDVYFASLSEICIFINSVL